MIQKFSGKLDNPAARQDDSPMVNPELNCDRQPENCYVPV
jgi:hypothetical protein